jgi:very-short-patch-repair endonuclease
MAHASRNDERVSRRSADKVARRWPDRAIARLAARQWGVVSHAQLTAAPLSRDEIARRARDGWLHWMHRGVYAVGHPNPPLEGRFLAAVMACGPGAVLSHFAAAALWGFIEWGHRLIEVTVQGPRAPSHPRIRTHRTERLDGVRDRRVHQRIPVTSPARTLLDLAPYLTPQELRSAVRRAQSLELVSIEELVDVLTRFRRRRGARKLARIIATGPAPTRSVLEDVVLDLLLSGGFEHPNVNKAMYLNGRKVVPDFRWERERIVVEADSRAWHDNKLAREDDAERQALLEAHGERVLRVTWEQAIARSAQTVARLRRAGVPLAH